MSVVVDFGYWRYSAQDSRRGLVSFDEWSEKLYYDVPGDGEIRLVLGRFASVEAVRTALKGWQDVVDVETYQWVYRQAQKAKKAALP